MMGTVMKLSSPVIWNVQGISVLGIQLPLPHLHPQQIPKVIPHTSQLKCPDNLRTHHHLYLSPHLLNKMDCSHLQISCSSIFLVIMRVIWTVLFLESLMMKNIYLLESVSRGRPFPTWYFNKFELKYVTKIPDDINGTSFYKIKVKQHMWHAVSADKRHFRMLTSSREGFFSERHIGTCKGTFECNNKQCPFIKTSHCHQPNRVSWRNVHGMHHVKICSICDHVAQCLDCGAKKLIATVYDLGTHKCTPQQPKRAIPVQHPHIQLGHTLRGSAKEVGLRQIVSLIDARDMDAAEKEAEVWLDRRRVKRQMESMDPHQGMDHNSFDAVGIVKQKTDKKDPFYIYRIGNRNRWWHWLRIQVFTEDGSDGT